LPRKTTVGEVVVARSDDAWQLRWQRGGWGSRVL